MQLFAELSLLVAIATIVSIVMKLLRQPLIIGYILTGLIIGPFAFNFLQSVETFSFFSEIGIAILLFIVGLSLTPSVAKEFGKVSLVTGIGQMVLTTIAGFFIAKYFGFSSISSFYISVALALSSTIIIMKLISDKGELDSLYAKICIGFLLVQDIIAIILLFSIPIFSEGGSWGSLLSTFGTGIGLVFGIIVISSILIPRLNNFLSSSQELLFIFAIAWGMGIASLFKIAGFSLESGALIAGVALSTLPSRHEISSRLSPLRDFFIVIFFVLLGAELHLESLGAILTPALVLSAFVLIGNPLILMIILGLMGYKKKTSLKTGLAIAQISEFSLILMALGFRMGHLDQDAMSLVTIVGLVTIFGSTYLISYSDQIYDFIGKYLRIFERKIVKEKRIKKSAHSVVLFGCNRIGYDFVDAFKKMGREFLVIDHNPETISDLRHKGIQVEYGDAGDMDFLETLDFTSVQFAISTVPDASANILINRAVKSYNPDAVVMVVAHRVSEALRHYEEGVDYVILPHLLGGKYASEIVLKMKDDKKKYNGLRKQHIEYLQLRLSVGHEHSDTGIWKL